MIAIVDKQTCVGCGICADTCTDVFEMKDGVAVVIGDAVPKAAESTCKDAASSCPVQAITTRP